MPITAEKTAHIFQKVARICAANQAVLAAYVFGSTVRPGKKIPDDIDVAVLLDDKHMATFSVTGFASELEKAFACRIDLVILNRAGELLKYHVRRDGILVFDRVPTMRKQFEIRGRKTYEDFLYLHKHYVRSVLYGEKHG